MRTITVDRVRTFGLLLLIIALACAFSVPSFGQAVNSGNIAGSVSDPQGAVVPGVTVKATDKATGQAYTATTNEQGRYFLANVPVSTYDITATKAGFSTAKVPAQTVSVGATSTLDIKMAVGEVSTTVEVQGAANTELQTMNATIGNTIPPAAITSLPAIGLDVSTFATLQPGVSPDGNAAGTSVDQSTFMLDGGNNTNDMDGSMTVYTGGFGADVTGGQGGGNQQPFSGNTGGNLPSGVVPTPADSVEEIKTNTTNQTADFNSSSGMQVQIVTKRGTNKWHGTAYDYYLDNNFSANSWQNNCSTACGKTTSVLRPDWHRSWFGVAGGGPLIPKDILGGKTYFFANYQGSRWPLSTTVNRNVPGPGMLQGLLEFNGTVYNLNPTATKYIGPTLAGQCKKCFLQNGVTYPVGASSPSGAPIDGTALDPRGLGANPSVNTVQQVWAKYVPTLLGLPGINYGGGAGDGNVFAYSANGATPVNDNFGVARLDHDFGAKWHFFGSFRYYRLINQGGAAATQFDIGGFTAGATAGVPKVLTSVPQVPWFYVAGLTTNITPTTTNDFHWSFTRNWWAWQRLGGPPQLSGLGGAVEPGGESANALIPYNVNTQNTRTRYWDGLDNMLRDDITSLKGNHLFQFGGTYQRNHDKHQRTDNGGGINYFPVYQEGGPSSSIFDATAFYLPSSSPAAISKANKNLYGQEYDEVLGIVNRTQIAYTRSGPNLALNAPLTPANEDSVIPFYNVYFSDSWHMKPSFTLTYGLGWTLELPPVDNQGRVVELVDGSNQPLDTLAYLKSKERSALQGVAYDPTIGFALVGNTANSPKYPFDPFYGSFSPRVAAAWNPDMGDSWLGRHVFGGKSTVIRGGYGRIYGRLNGVDLVLVPLLGTGLIQPVTCSNPTATGGAASCGAGTAASAFRIGKDGLVAPLAAASPTLPQPDFPGISSCPTSVDPTALCPAASAGSSFDPHFKPNSVDSFTATIQRQFGQRNTLEVGYIGRLIHNEYQPMNINVVPYMFTKGGQQFQQAYAAIEKQMGCATSVANCYLTGTNGFIDAATAGQSGCGAVGCLTAQPFFEAALSGTGYCTGYKNCTTAVADQEFSNFASQNVWSLWSDLDQNFPATGTPGFNFGPTLLSAPGGGGAACTGAAGAQTCGTQLADEYVQNASVGYGNYHAGFVSWRMSSWHGFTSQSNLTWSKALGTGTVVQATSGFTVDDPFNLKSSYGLQPFDRKLVFNTFLVYEPPFFKGQQGFLGRLLGGWNIAPLFSAGSGLPVFCNGTVGGTTAQAFGGSSGADAGDTEECVKTGPIPSPARVTGVKGGTDIAGNGVGDAGYSGAPYNAFGNPLAVWNNLRPMILGIDNGHSNSGTGIIHGMPFWNMDLSVKKNIRISERFSTTFGAVFTNIFNHNQFLDPVLDLSNSDCFGVLAASCSGGPEVSTPRRVELGLRINF